MSHVFISYSRKDKEAAYKIQRQLEGKGFKVWIDKNDIPGGSNFPVEILTAIQKAVAVLVLWSKNSAASTFVNKEIDEALSQRMMRSIPVIPVWLDDEALPSNLSHLNAIRMVDCGSADIAKLTHHLSTIRYREFSSFKEGQTLHQQSATQLITLPSLVSIPLVRSVYCDGRIISTPNMSLSAAKTHPARKIQVLLEFSGKANSEDSIVKIYNMLQSLQPDIPFFMFHFTGYKVGLDYTMVDAPEESPHGGWLDSVNTVHETLDTYLGRGRATMQIFNVLPASLNFAIGMQFFKFWSVELFHYIHRQERYQLVLDSAEL